MRITELLSEIEYESSEDVSRIDVESVTSRVENINDSCVFVLLKGINFDTQKIINYVIENKPKAIVCNREQIIESKIPTVRVKDARRALSYMLFRYYGIDREKTDFVAVTGTNGKTTTATILEKIMLRAQIKTGFIGTGRIAVNDSIISDRKYSMTTPDPEALYPTIKKMQDEGCKVIIMEVSSHSLALGKVAPIKFLYSIFTNLSSEHLDFHRDINDYYYTKLSLFLQTENGIFNADDEYSAMAMRDSFDLCNTMSVGILWDGEAMARDVILDGFKGSKYIYREASLLFKVDLKIPGYYNIYNSLLAIKCALDYGIKPLIAKEAVSAINNIDGRFEIYRSDVTVIIDYAHTARAFESILKTVNSLKNTRQNVITVFGCGGDRDALKRPQMGRISECYSKLVIITTDNSRSESDEKIISDIITGMNDECKRRIIPKRDVAITSAILDAEPDDIILILGKGHERYSIDKNGYHDFDERQIVADALNKRKVTVRNEN